MKRFVLAASSVTRVQPVSLAGWHLDLQSRARRGAQCSGRSGRARRNLASANAKVCPLAPVRHSPRPTGRNRRSHQCTTRTPRWMEGRCLCLATGPKRRSSSTWPAHEDYRTSTTLRFAPCCRSTRHPASRCWRSLPISLAGRHRARQHASADTCTKRWGFSTVRSQSSIRWRSTGQARSRSSAS